MTKILRKEEVCRIGVDTPRYRDEYREKLISRVNSGGGWYNGDENAARDELEKYEIWRRRTDHDTD